MKNYGGWIVAFIFVPLLSSVLFLSSLRANSKTVHVERVAPELSLAVGVMSAATGLPALSDQESRAGTAVQRVMDRALIARSDPTNEAYAGWLAYLSWRVENGQEPYAKLTEWLDRIDADQEALSKQRGRFEWAYLSKIDETGQPFVIAIPDDYDSERAWPLVITLHAWSWTHSGAVQLKVESPDLQEPFVQIWPLGRSRGSRWGSLAEVDVIEALDYVRGQWNIDPDRIHLEGFSMGGHGAFRLGSRHPDWFASARPQAGYAPAENVENMLNLPVYALHNQGDPDISISESRSPTHRLAEFGGQAIFEELPGNGHFVVESVHALQRQMKWAFRQVRRQAVRRVHYTALDEIARGAYWVEIVEWGIEGRPATIDARIGLDNDLHLTLDNVGVLEVDVAASPVDRESAMMVVIDGTIVATLTAPLPDSMFIIRQEGAWKLSEERPPDPPQRLHFPGGSMALFHGEPIMVVWATQGDEETNKRIYRVAQLARKSTSPAWRDDEDGDPLLQMLYGRLPGKPDVEVTAEDIAKYNLLLFGDASENAIVARIADRLPVQIKDGRIRSDDGFSWSFKDRGLGLLYYNPLSPQRLVYWVAFDDPEGYRPVSDLTAFWAEPAPADFLLMTSGAPNAFVAARRFDSRWNWETGYGGSPLVSDEGRTEAGYMSALARVLRLAVGADFALVELTPHTGAEGMRIAASKETRKMDLVAAEYDRRISVMDLTGKEILAMVQALEEMVGNDPFHDRMSLLPDPSAQDVEPDRIYRVAVKGWTYHWASKGNNLPDFRTTEHTVREAVVRFWPVAKQ